MIVEDEQQLDIQDNALARAWVMGLQYITHAPVAFQRISHTLRRRVQVLPGQVAGGKRAVVEMRYNDRHASLDFRVLGLLFCVQLPLRNDLSSQIAETLLYSAAIVKQAI